MSKFWTWKVTIHIRITKKIISSPSDITHKFEKRVKTRRERVIPLLPNNSPFLRQLAHFTVSRITRAILLRCPYFFAFLEALYILQLLATQLMLDTQTRISGIYLLLQKMKIHMLKEWAKHDTNTNTTPPSFAPVLGLSGTVTISTIGAKLAKLLHFLCFGLLWT